MSIQEHARRIETPEEIGEREGMLAWALSPRRLGEAAGMRSAAIIDRDQIRHALTMALDGLPRGMLSGVVSVDACHDVLDAIGGPAQGHHEQLLDADEAAMCAGWDWVLG